MAVDRGNLMTTATSTTNAYPQGRKVRVIVSRTGITPPNQASVGGMAGMGSAWNTGFEPGG